MSSNLRQAIAALRKARAAAQPHFTTAAAALRAITDGRDNAGSRRTTAIERSITILIADLTE